MEPEERWKAFLFTLLAAMLQVGIALGVSGADSLFLTHVGADKLPIIYVVTPVLLLLYIPALSNLTTRFGMDRVMDLTMILLAASGIGFFFALLHHPSNLVYYAIKLTSNVWYIALYTLYWNFTDNYFDIQDGKRLFPIFSGGAAAGTLIGGLVVSELMVHFSVAWLFLLWAILAGLSIPIGWMIRRRFAQIEVLSEKERSKRLPQELRETLTYFQRFRYVRLLVMVVFLLAALTTVNEYHFSTVFAHGRSDVQLAALFGRLFALANALSLFINIFIFPRAVLRFGVGNMALVAPVVLLVTYLWYLLDYGYRAGLVGFFAINGIVSAIDYNNWNLLYNGVPGEARRQVRTVLNGLADPATISFVGIVLLVAASAVTPDRLSVIGILSAAVMLTLVFSLRSAYRITTADNLKREWLDFSRPEQAVLGALSDGEQQGVATAMRESIADGAQSNNAGMLRMGIRILWLNNHLLATESLLEYLSSPAYLHPQGMAPLTSGIVDTVHHRPEGTSPNGMTPRLLTAEESLLEMALSGNDSAVIRRVLPWLDPQESLLPAGWIGPLGEYGLIRPQDAAHLLSMPDVELQGAATSALWHSWRPEDRQRAFEVVRRLLEKREPRSMAVAIRSLGHSGQERMAYQLLPYLENANAEIRHEAMVALRRLVSVESARLVPALLRAIARAEGEDRAIGMEALGEIQDTDCIAPLLALGERFTPFERRVAERILVGIGLKSVPTLVSLLRDPQNSRRSRSIAARALSKLSPPQLEAVAPEIIVTELRGVYVSLERYRSLTETADGNAGIGLLRRFYLDQRRVVIDFVLELLTLGGRLPDFELISASLYSSARKVRANAIETIEQGISREAFRLLLPLIDGRTAAQSLEWYHAYAKTSDPLTNLLTGHSADAEDENARLRSTLNASLESGTALECAAAAQALWERHGREVTSLLRNRLHNRHRAFSVTDVGEGIGVGASDDGDEEEADSERFQEIAANFGERREETSAALPTLLRETVLSLVGRAGTTARNAPEDAADTSKTVSAVPAYTLVEKMLILSQSPFFRNFTVFDLEAIVPRTTVREIAPGESVFLRGEPADKLYVIVSGIVIVQAAGRENTRREAGDVVGKSALFGTTLGQQTGHRLPVYTVDVVAETSARLVAVPAEALLHAAHNVPHVGIALLREKVALRGVSRTEAAADAAGPVAAPTDEMPMARALATAGEAVARTPGSETGV